MQRRIRRVGLDGELIERNVIVREVKRFTQFFAPCCGVCPGRA